MPWRLKDTELRQEWPKAVLNHAAIHFSSLQNSSALQTKIERGGKILILFLFQGACSP